MNTNKALKTKNILAKNLKELQHKLVNNNIFEVRNINQVEYKTDEILNQYIATLNDLVDIKTKIAKANVEIYDKIFRLAELKGLVCTLGSIPVKLGKESGSIYGRQVAEEIEYDSTLKQKVIDEKIKTLEAEMERLQDDLDKHNFTTEV